MKRVVLFCYGKINNRRTFVLYIKNSLWYTMVNENMGAIYR